ncbi:MAG TPA: hypothetical protein VFM18_02885 [Methanosarcina sp.]|nr:hypothetical protein [Methanosarcina sp.]
MVTRVRANRLVIATEQLKSGSIKRLADKLSERLGYKVWRVRPDRVRGRRHITFPNGVDKVTQFQQFAANNVSCPKFTTDPAQIPQLEEFKDQKIVVRTLTNSSSGKGIQIIGLNDPVPRAPLYTQYVPKKHEYRVHVFNNGVIDVSQKKKRKDHSGERDTHIRNLENGYVFCRDGVVEPNGLRDLAVAAVQALGRSQGAVDVIYNERLDRLYVLEVNSCPGMEGTTLDRYVEAIVNA